MLVEITYSCGHKGMIEVYGKPDRVKWIISQREKDECPACVEKWHQEQNELNAQRMKDAGAAELEGTPKQVAWAETIRADIIDQLEQRVSLYDKSRLPYAIEAKEQLVQELMAEKSASKLIDMRNRDVAAMLSKRFWQVKKNPEKSIQEYVEVKPVTVLETEEKSHDGIVKIEMDEDKIVLDYEKNDEFRSIVKAHGFYWRNRHWTAVKTPNAASLIDKAAYLGNDLLLAGFSIASTESKLIDLIKSAEFTPDEKEYVAKDSYMGKEEFHVYYDKNEDLKNYAMHLPGAKDIHWEGYVKLPKSCAPEVGVLVDIYGIFVADDALKMLAPIQREEVTVQRKDPEGASGSVKDILDTSREVIDDLKD